MVSPSAPPATPAQNRQAWGATAIKAGPREAIGWATVESQEALDAALASQGAAIMADVPNYINVAPQMVIGEISR